MAFPQYTKAVEKSRQAEAWTLMKSVNDAIKIYQMEQGTEGVVPAWEDMSITFAHASGASAGQAACGTGTLNGKAFNFTPTANGVTAARQGGRYSYTLGLTFTGERWCKASGSNCKEVGSKSSTSTCPSVLSTVGSGSCYKF